MKKQRIKKLLAALLALVQITCVLSAAGVMSVAADSVSYKDVKSDRWSYSAIVFATQNGYMNGKGGGYFNPEETMTRAMVVTVLYRMQGEPAVEYKSVFSDVKRGDWYASAILWAAEKNIVNGTGNGRYDPMEDVTREQLAAILLRYAQREYYTNESASINGYSDYKKIHSYAREALAWANATGLITGVTTTTLKPRSGATREQFATILRRLIEYTLKAKRRPISITELPEISRGFNFYWNQGASEDPFGNDYSTACNYVMAKYSTDIEYKTAGKYSTLSLKVAPSVKARGYEDDYGWVQVFADGELVCTSPKITKRTDAVTVEANIEGADCVKIKIGVKLDGAVILSDVIVSPDKQAPLAPGTSLISLPMIQNISWFWRWNEHFPESLSGDDYSLTRNYVMYSDSLEHETEWRANCKFKTISGQVAPYVETARIEDAYGVIKIYADDRLVYTSPEINMRSDAISFNVDIGNCDYVKISAKCFAGADIIISDVLLHE